MRYSTALVLSTFAVGQAAAAHNRHASFHERRQADSKRGVNAVDWDAVAIDLKDVDWEKINWSSVFASSAPTPTPTPVVASPEPVDTPVQQPATPSVEAKKQDTPAPSSSKPAQSATVKTDSILDTINNIVTELTSEFTQMVNDLGAKTGKNSKTNNGGIWIGSDSAWQTTWTNDGTKDAVLYCWKADGFSGMSINVNQPEVSIGLKSGETVTLSFAENVPAACAPMTSSDKLALFGGCDQTWFEVTFGHYGAFDISRNVNMNGINISSKGSKCTSDMDTCVFMCKGGLTTCEAGTDYDLFNCGAGTGGGGGYDTIMQGTGGGCAMGTSGEKIQASFW
ncbi:hypothetical protein ACN47E_000652 [Coniothyrium glycines]